MALTREKILKNKGIRRIDKIEVPEWAEDDGKPGEVYLRSLFGRERDQFDVSITTVNARGDSKFVQERLREKLLVLTLCDEKGNPLFTHADIVLLSEMDGAVIDRVYERSAKMNRILKEEPKDVPEKEPAATPSTNGVSHSEHAEVKI